MSKPLDAIVSLVEKKVAQEAELVKELKALLYYMSNRPLLSSSESDIFYGILNSLLFIDALGFEDFVRYARRLGNYDMGTLEEWWTRPKHHFWQG